MANFDPTFFTALVTRIKAAWPDVTSVRRSTAADRLQLENELRAATQTLPQAFVHVGIREEAPEWGLQNQVYSYPCTILYIASVEGLTAVTATFEAKMATLRDSLITYNSGAFQVVEFPEIFVESSNDINEVLFSLGTGAFAGELTCKLLVGEIL